MTLEKHFENLHKNPPAGFNPDFRPGFGEAVSEAYAIMCEQNPNLTREQRKAEHKKISDALRPLFPSRRELSQKCPEDL